MILVLLPFEKCGIEIFQQNISKTLENSLAFSLETRSSDRGW